MPPKKAPAAEPKALLGRPSNNLKMGIVGLANIGKSSTFNVISKTDLGKTANYPYATVDPEEARVPLPDERFEWLCDLYKPASRIPAHLTIIDIAGLTRGSHTGEGMGNSFLSHIRAVDGIYQLVRAFDDADVTHVEGDVDPVRDMEIISNELRLKDTEWVEKHLDGLKKTFRGTGTASLADKAKKEEITSVEKVLDVLKSNKDVRKADWSAKEIDVVNGLQLLTAKPVVYLVNLSEKDYIRKKNKWLPKIKQWIDSNNPGDPLIPYSVVFEETLVDLSKDDQKKKCEELGAPAALGKITTAGYQALHLIRYFTCGPDEVRAWTIRENTKAPQAAGVIHTDFENKFISADIMAYNDLRELGSEAAVKAEKRTKSKMVTSVTGSTTSLGQ
ncbi:cytoplasmic protein [Atractiella rhizophila]|nr:cytoplasmic protein [Atractiella rhizophila]